MTMRLIDANYVLAHLKPYELSDEEWSVTGGTVLRLIHTAINQAPTIDAEVVRHGRIIEFWDDAYRPRRKFSCCDTDCTTLTQWVWPKYCPYCGAKLEGEVEQ